MNLLPDRMGGRWLKEADFPGLLLYAIAGFTSASLLWAALAKVDVVVAARGRLTPTSQLQTLSNLEGGTISRIAVSPGQVVRAGQELLLLDPVLRASDAAAGQASVDALSARAARLSAEARGSGTPIDLPRVDPQLLASERALAQSDAASLASERGLALARQDQAQRAVIEAEAQLEQRQEALRLAVREEAVIRPLVEQGAEPRLSLDRLASQRLQAEATARAAEAALSRANAGLAEADRAVSAVGTRFRSRAAEALATTRAELASRSGQQPALADRLARTKVRAPVAGIVLRLLVNTPGAAVSPGQPLVELVPVGDKLQIEARVTPADIGFVKAGQQANVRITAYDYSLYGAITGLVHNVAPDAVVDQRTGEVHFMVRIALPSTCFATQDTACLSLRPGMQADVSILGPKRSVLSYLLSPLNAISSRAFQER